MFQSAGYTKTVIAEPSVPDLRIVNVFNEDTTVQYTADASALQQTVDFENLQWQSLDRSGYAGGDTLLWEGSVQVDQITNLHSLGVLETATASTVSILAILFCTSFGLECILALTFNLVSGRRV